MDRNVVGAVLFGIVAVLTSHTQLLDVVWCHVPGAVVVILLVTVV